MIRRIKVGGVALYDSDPSYRVIVRTPDGDRPVEGSITRPRDQAQAICDSMARLAKAKGWTLTYRIERVES